MTDQQDKRFQHRWEFRRTETDLDSSSDDDDGSRPSSANETKQKKQKPVTGQNHQENTQQIIHSPASYARGEKERISGSKEPNKKAENTGKKDESKAKAKRAKRTTSSHEFAGSAALFDDLKGHMESLVEEIKTARGDLLAWMENKMKSPSKDDMVSSRPRRQNPTRSKALRKNPINRKRKTGKVTQNDEGGSPPRDEKAAAPTKETENVVIDVIPVDKVEKQKGKRSRSSTNKKQKTVEVEADQQSNTTVAAAADNYLTLPTVLPQKQVDNSKDENEKDGGNRNAASNSGTSLSSHQLKFDPRPPQQNDVVFAQNGMRNVSSYEQNTSTSMGNGSGNGYPFPMVPQCSNGGIGMSNIHSQFGLQYLPGMYREHHGFSNENHGFMGSYSGFSQHLKFNAQQSGVMALQCPDIRRGPFNQGNMTS